MDFSLPSYNAATQGDTTGVKEAPGIPSFNPFGSSEPASEESSSSVADDKAAAEARKAEEKAAAEAKKAEEKAAAEAKKAEKEARRQAELEKQKEAAERAKQKKAEEAAAVSFEDSYVYIVVLSFVSYV